MEKEKISKIRWIFKEIKDIDKETVNEEYNKAEKITAMEFFNPKIYISWMW